MSSRCILLDANRTDDYKLPHDIKHEEPVSDDIFLDSDDTDDLVARTLDYEGLHASLPSPTTTSIRKVMRRFVIREIVRGSFFRVFFLELQLMANRGGRNLCNINLSWERRRE